MKHAGATAEPTPQEIIGSLERSNRQSSTRMAMLVLRVVFIFIAAGIAILSLRETQAEPAWLPLGAFLGIMFLAAMVIIIDAFTPNKRIETVSAIYFGLLVGILLAYMLSIALTPLIEDELLQGRVRILISIVLCYGCVSLLIQTKDDFRFIIPYVEFSRELKGNRPIILDTSALIDGRLAELFETRILDNQLVIPSYVLGELQGIADSSDKLKRVRGRRGLDILNRLQTSELAEVVLDDKPLPDYAGQPVDMKLVVLAKHLDAKIMTGDFNLNKVAKVHKVHVINLNEVAGALRPQFLPGEFFQIRIVKTGEGPTQGVGYLDDGTMVVVENARNRQNETLQVSVTSTLQTPAGRMIFAKFDE